MNDRNGQNSLLDALAIVSFMLGLANYDENLGQSQIQEMVSQAVGDIHSHLEEQDRKIDLILIKVGGDIHG
jgi:CheY-specific phosphatase CheX